jgi:CHAT domain-containing protein
MGALFDGKQYLVENYNVSTIISASLTNPGERLPSGTQNSPVLALGLSNAVANFNPLPGVPAS